MADDDDLLEIKCQLETQTAWRKVYVPPNCSYEHFLTLASDEFGSPVVVYEYKDLSGDIIDHDQDKPIVGWGRLLKFLQKQTEAGNYAELKVWVRPGRRKSVEAPAPLLKRGSASEMRTSSSTSSVPAQTETSAPPSPTSNSPGNINVVKRGRAASGSRSSLTSASRSVVVSPPAPAGTTAATVVEFSSEAPKENGAPGTPQNSESRRSKPQLAIVVPASGSPKIPRGTDLDEPFNTQRRVSDVGPRSSVSGSPRSPSLVSARRLSTDSTGDRRGSTGSIDDDDEIQILEAAKMEYVNDVMGSPALSRTPPSMVSLLNGEDVDSLQDSEGSDDDTIPEFLRLPGPEDVRADRMDEIPSNDTAPAGRDSDGAAQIQVIAEVTPEKGTNGSPRKKDKPKKRKSAQEKPRRTKSSSSKQQQQQQQQEQLPRKGSKALIKAKDDKPVTFTWKRGGMLGKGAFGNVYKGFTSTGQLIAVKHLELSPDTNLEKNTHYISFKKEIDLLKSFRHPNIVRYFGSEVDKNNVYVFLEYAPGGSISSLLVQYGSFHESLIRVYAKDILNGLDYLHENGIAHRDIKGGNILVDTTGHAKLADFGCSKSMEGLATQDQQFKTMLGTPYWMAPEVMKQQGYDGRKSDIWSFACTIIEMAAGKPPWADEYTQVAALLFAVAATEATPTIPDHLSDDCKQFLRLCFQRDPNGRPTAAELLRHRWLTSAKESHRINTLSLTPSFTDSSSPLSTPRSLTNSSGGGSGGGGLRVSGKSNLLAMSRDREGRTGLFEISLSASLTQAVAFAQAQFEMLPKEAAYRIFAFLDLADLLNVKRVCAQWRFLVSRNLVWKRFAFARWPKLGRTTGIEPSSVTDSDDSESSDPTETGHDEDRWMRKVVTRVKYDRHWQGPKNKFVQIGQLKGHQKHVYCAQLVGDATKVITGAADRKIKLWELKPSESSLSAEDGKKKASVTLKGHSGSVRCVHASQSIAFSGSSDASVRVWDLNSRKCVLTLKSHEDVVTSLQFDKSKLVSASLDGSCKVFDLTAGTTLKNTLSIPSTVTSPSSSKSSSSSRPGINCVRFWHDLVVAGSTDGLIYMWDLRAPAAGVPTRTFARAHTDEVTCIDFMNDVIVSGSVDGTVREWLPSQDSPVGIFQPADVLETKKSSVKIYSVLFDGINNVAAARSDGRISLWNYNSEKSYHTLKASESAVLSIDWQGDHLVSTGQDKLTKLWAIR